MTLKYQMHHEIRRLQIEAEHQIIILAIMLRAIISVSNNVFIFVSAYAQAQGTKNTSSPTSFPSSSFQSKVATIDNIPSRNVTVGDIDIAYKQLGKADAKPIILITGDGATMDMWSPLLLDNLTSSNYRVIIFDNRGTGESSLGTEEFSINQFTNDTAGLLDALNINKTDVLGWSMGSLIAQELALRYPDKVGNLILYGSDCGGSEAVPPNPEVIQLFTNTSIPPQELEQELIALLFPTEWFNEHPNYLDYFPIPRESVSPEILRRQSEAIANWTGTCDAISNITQSTLIIVGTDDVFAPPANSLMLAERIPGSWLVRITDAGHGLMYQFPGEFNNVLKTFLETYR